MGIKVKAALNVLIFRKTLRMSRIRDGVGEVINLMSTDVTRVNDAVVNFHFLWSAFLEAALIVILAFIEIEVSAIPALVFVSLLTPLQMYLGKLTSDLNRQQTTLTTDRVHMMSEIWTAIKLIKFYAWEKPFTEKIDELLSKEIEIIKKGMIMKAIYFLVVFKIPVIISLTLLGTYVAL
jgi:ABC-type bacteriocin/lantibiotic exporter with double-glycine peptidase domain